MAVPDTPIPFAPVIRESAIAGVTSVAKVLLSADHRFINGREAVRFLSALEQSMAAF